MQGYVEDQFGLGLIARAVEESIEVVKPTGAVILNMGGRPGQAVCERLFLRRGFNIEKLWQTRVFQVGPSCSCWSSFPVAPNSMCQPPCVILVPPLSPPESLPARRAPSRWDPLANRAGLLSFCVSTSLRNPSASSLALCSRCTLLPLSIPCFLTRSSSAPSSSLIV